MDPKISVLLVNLNNLEFTKNCFSDLLTQDIPFNLKLVDQNSQEEGTREFLQTIFDEHTKFGKYHGKINYLEIINSGSNRPLNHLWNEFVSSATTPFLCILNNDVRIAPNFLSSALEVFEKEQSVGFVNHPTNNKNYCEWSQDLNYLILDSPYRQGWDFIFRKECYHEIPSDLNFFFGDDYLYSKLYQSGNKGAYVLNSPMIHFERSTTQEKGGIRDCSGDGDFFHSLNLEIKNLDFPEKFSKWKPEYESIQSKNKYFKENYITKDPDIRAWESHLNAVILDQYKELLFGNVADFGCNHGACTIIAARKEKVRTITGLDLNVSAIKQANELIATSGENPSIEEKIKFRVANFLNLNRIPDNHFDSGFCFHTLEHIYPDDYDAVFSEWQRVFKNGANFIVSVPYLHAYDDPCHVNYFDENSLGMLFIERGFDVIECYRDQRLGFDCLNLVAKIRKKKIDLTVIICSLLERRDVFLKNLLGELERQIGNKENVEILVISDNAKRPIGEKRNDGLKMAKGDFVCFIDDDDMVSEDYIDLILNQIHEWNPDVIVFDALISFDGHNHKLVKYGREFDHEEKEDAFYRRPNHLLVHKRTNITEFFKEIKTGEDDEWAFRMLDRIVTQSRINKILYFYDYRTTTKKYFV